MPHTTRCKHVATKSCRGHFHRSPNLLPRSIQLIQCSGTHHTIAMPQLKALTNRSVLPPFCRLQLVDGRLLHFRGDHPRLRRVPQVGLHRVYCHAGHRVRLQRAPIPRPALRIGRQRRGRSAALQWSVARRSESVVRALNVERFPPLGSSLRSVSPGFIAKCEFDLHVHLTRKFVLIAWKDRIRL